LNQCCSLAPRKTFIDSIDPERTSPAFQLAEVAVPRMLFTYILPLIAELWPPPDPALA